MIVPMKKIALILKASDAEEGLRRLRKYGEVHVELLDNQNDSVEEASSRLERLTTALAVLSEYKKKYDGVQKKAVSSDEIFAIVDEVLSLSVRLKELKEDSFKLAALIKEMSEWGDFSLEDINFLRTNGLAVEFVYLSKQQKESLDNSIICVDLGKASGRFRCLLLSRDKQDIVPTGADRFVLPDSSLSALIVRQEELYKNMREISGKLVSLYAWHDELVRLGKEVLEPELTLRKVEASLREDGPVVFLTGYVPAEKEKHFIDYARKHEWGIITKEPDEEDNPPTLLRNPRWMQIIKPVFNFLDTVPGYREFDISFVFLAFLSVFFAMIVGDAGYGAIFLAGSVFILRKEYKKTGQVTDVGVLIAWMSLCTIIWGSLTGTWFGYEGFAKIKPFSYFVIPELSSWEEVSIKNIQFISFLLGIIHISIAHLWRFLRELKKKPAIRAFAQLGWLAIMLGIFNLVLSMVLDPQKYPFLPVSLYGIIAGFIIVVFFSEQGSDGFFRGVLRGLAGLFTTALDTISAFGDIISYIRLFAVGLATIALAQAFNDMAIGAANGVVGIIIAFLILLVGHALNLVMSALSVVVHGIRLNLLEFAGHLGMEWTGIPYSPFKEPVRQHQADKNDINIKE
ncbi:V-type ATP synthase subunit I [Spirochaetia bacterium 38H-sp]|uniref:V-type ATP synthase subunit I n=1 Tax=Rarispira pelagica TaxID=3141764 RepID=A0ABU9UAM1_9SPIR